MFSKLTTQCRTTEVSSVSENLGLTYKKRSLESDTYLAGLFANLESKSALLKTAINRSKAESDLDDKDVIRDENVQALYYLLLGAMHNPSAETSGSATRLYAKFKKYGLKMIQESYLIESALMESMLEDYAAPDLQADIAAVLGCAELIANLQTAQTNFKTANLVWGEEKSKDGLIESATEIKKAIFSIINHDIIPYLKVMSQANNAVYGELAQAVSQIINGVNQAVRKRNKKDEEVAV